MTGTHLSVHTEYGGEQGTQASECRIPRRSRGSGTATKHSSRFPPDAALSAAARAASSPGALSAQGGHEHATLDRQRGLPAGEETG